MPRPAECCVICLAALLDKHCRGLEMITYARGQFSFHCYSAGRKEESEERFTLPWWFYLKCNFMYFWWQGNCFSSCLQSSWTVSHPPWASSKMPCTYIFKCFKWDIYKYIYICTYKKNLPFTLLVQKAFYFDWEQIVHSHPQSEAGQIPFCAHFHIIMVFMYTQMDIHRYTHGIFVNLALLIVLSFKSVLTS